MNKKYSQDLINTRADIERFERMSEVPKLSRRERRHRDRIALLNRRVPDRRCPCCLMIKINSKQWVVLPMFN